MRDVCAPENRGPWWMEFVQDEEPATPSPRGGDIFDILADRRRNALRVAVAPAVEMQAPLSPAAMMPKRARVRPRVDYPNRFMNKGLRLIMTGDPRAARAFYLEQQCHESDSLAPYGLAAVALSERDLDEAAAHLLDAWAVDPHFPVSRLLHDVRPDEPEAWYALAGRLVATRSVNGYKCADAVLRACLDATDDPTLRDRVERVRGTIVEALAVREQRDRKRAQQPRRPLLRHTLALVCLLVFVAAVCTLAVRTFQRPGSASVTRAGAAMAVVVTPPMR